MTNCPASPKAAGFEAAFAAAALLASLGGAPGFSSDWARASAAENTTANVNIPPNVRFRLLVMVSVLSPVASGTPGRTPSPNGRLSQLFWWDGAPAAVGGGVRWKRSAAARSV